MIAEQTGESSPKPDVPEGPKSKKEYIARCKANFHARRTNGERKYHIRYFHEEFTGRRVVTLVAARDMPVGFLYVGWAVCNKKDQPNRYAGLEKAMRDLLPVGRTGLPHRFATPALVTEKLEKTPALYRQRVRSFIDEFIDDPEAFIRTKPYRGEENAADQ